MMSPESPEPRDAPDPVPGGSSLVEQFEATTLPLEHWRHETHVRVAYHYLTQYDLPDAIDQMRRGIQRYNAAHEISEAIERGYHETLTQAWLRLLHAIIVAHGPFESADAMLEMHPYIRCKVLLRLFYTRDWIMSDRAKRQWVEPDICALPPLTAELQSESPRRC